MDEIRLESYSAALIENFPDDVDTLLVLAGLSMTPRDREAFEPVIPPKADLIRMVRAEDWKRKRKAREDRESAKAKADADEIAAERAAGTLEHLDVTAAIKDAVAAKDSKPRPMCEDDRYSQFLTGEVLQAECNLTVTNGLVGLYWHDDSSKAHRLGHYITPEEEKRFRARMEAGWKPRSK